MITIYTTETTTRLSYTVAEIFGNRLGLTPRFTTQIDEFKAANGLKINYSNTALGEGLHMIPQGLLFSEGITQQYPDVITDEQWHTQIWPNKGGDIPFDLFAATFYLLTRYEEYTTTERDTHNRYTAQHSLAYAHHFLEVPLVDVWCKELKNILMKIKPDQAFKKHTYQQLVTIDVDFAFKYAGLSAIRWLGKLAKNLLNFDLKEAVLQIKSTLNNQHDPYNTYDFINETTQGKAGYFILMSNTGGFDKNINPTSKALHKLVNRLKNNATFLGIHPSYASNQKPERARKEKALLETILGSKITRSRQHFLKLDLPNTYQNLIQQGITHDYTLFYAEQPGFRASTCFPFTFYNLRADIFTGLTIMPTCIMDTTLEQYQNLPHNLWQNALLKLEQTIKSHDGMFISLWHNNTFASTQAQTVLKNIVTN